jgi:hypothetical protein
MFSTLFDNLTIALPERAILNRIAPARPWYDAHSARQNV